MQAVTLWGERISVIANAISFFVVVNIERFLFYFSGLSALDSSLEWGRKRNFISVLLIDFSVPSLTKKFCKLPLDKRGTAYLHE